VNDEPTELKILALRGQIAELGGAIRQLQQSGLDCATAQLLISRKRAELEFLMKSQGIRSRQNGGEGCVEIETPEKY
jgi:hypothetical protein